ncbi:MAG: protein kinase [Myxococcales bacterium]|nr:protein kinase [Myxococcales bacterium]MDD9967885.1 protein kinase [Myxococcales bacterium]
MTLVPGTPEHVRQDPQLIGGRWEVIRPLADGGMGRIYTARHVQTRREAAVKVIERSDPEAQARFRIEAGVASELGHPGVVDVFDADVDPTTGHCFIAMELLRGRTLRSVMDDSHTAPREIFDLLVEALDPLVVAHSKGYVHRDLKPENIFVVDTSATTRVKLLDFGIAGHEERRGLTQTGTAMGTPHYMSPEQAMNARDATPAADIWAMGVLMYEALSGRTPFTGETAHAVVVHACTADPPELSSLVGDVEPELAALVMRCLDKDPDRRPRDASALLSELSHLVRADSLPAQRGKGEITRFTVHHDSGVQQRLPSDVSSLIPQTGIATHGPLVASILGAALMLLSLLLYASSAVSLGQLAFFGLLGTLISGVGMFTLRSGEASGRTPQKPVSAHPAAASEHPVEEPQIQHPTRGTNEPLVQLDLYVDLSCALSRRISQRVMDILHDYRDCLRVTMYPLPPSDKNIAWLTAEATREAYEREGSEAFWIFHDRLLLQRRKITMEVLDELAMSLGLNTLSFRHAMRARVHRGTVMSIREQARNQGATSSPAVVINGQLVESDLSHQSLLWAVQDAIKLADQKAKAKIDIQQTAVALPSGIPNVMQLRQILVCFRGARRAPRNVRRSREQALERAEKLRARACLPGADFADLAMRFSDADLDLGTLELHGLPEPTLDAVMGLAVGGISRLIETDDGFRFLQRVK